jgi:alpha-L-fucosidase
MSHNTGATSDWSSLDRPLPEWFRDSPFGIFIHWGAYSVPAWAEPIGALGTVSDDREWFTHNPYAEWYMNTIRIEGSPAQAHHQAAFTGVEYDGLLEQWKAENFDPQEWAALFKAAGADYVVPTTKHHDGITRWDAPGTGERNTVHRGPHRDLIADIAGAVRDHGLHLGLYYSGGLDWHVRPFPPHLSTESVDETGRPKDAEYAQYAYNQVLDLINKYKPEVLWNDINWPDAGKNFGSFGLGTLFEKYYDAVPQGVVNDRWGDTHKDYSTSEYENFKESESAAAWENCRGLGFSFGYNQVEGPELTLSGKEIARQLVDVVSRGGRFLLNVGPQADGTIPDLQRRSLMDMGRWMVDAKPLLVGAMPLDPGTAGSQDAPWVRWVDRGDEIVAFVDDLTGDATVELNVKDVALRTADAAIVGGGAKLNFNGDRLHVKLGPGRVGPALVRIPRIRPQVN